MEEDAMKSKRWSVITGVLVGALAGFLLAGTAGALEAGDKAPDFTLVGPEGKPVKLSDLTAKGSVVLYTFIAAFTPT
jgi:cytochrome oxidase Cu insertion factor (SCO1/SenC/PrrC family)